MAKTNNTESSSVTSNNEATEAVVSKTLDVTNIAEAKAKIPDIKVIGNGDAWQLLGKASSKEQGWMKSTKAYEIPGYGVVLQVSTQQGSNVAEALVTIPSVKIVEDINGGKKLVSL